MKSLHNYGMFDVVELEGDEIYDDRAVTYRYATASTLSGTILSYFSSEDGAKNHFESSPLWKGEK